MSFIHRFVRSPKPFPALAGLAGGLYPLFFYYTRNFTLVNSWGHLWYFLAMFIVVPVIGSLVAWRIAKFPIFDRWRKYLLPFLNLFIFLFFMKVCLYAGLQKKITLGIGIVSMIYAFTLFRHYKKVIVIQLVLACIGFFTVSATLISQLSFSEEWKKPTDDIESAILQQKPNIYFLQPDGYVNFSELKKGYYHYDNSAFETYLVDQGFTNYSDFRTNYASTLSSNSSTLMMKHHYYNRGVSFSEAIDARSTIMGENTVLKILDANGYKTHFISQFPYLMMNHPKVFFDYTNFDLKDVNYITSGFEEKADIVADLASTYTVDPDAPKFYFIEFFRPGHIKGRKEETQGAEIERELWLERLEESNGILRELITAIQESDPNALILMMGDHGGFVGLDYTNQIYEKTQDRDKVYSIFSSQLSIKYPEGISPIPEGRFVSSVNVFRILFAHLSQQSKYLDHLEPDESFVVIHKGAPKGIYKYIDAEGNVVFEKH